MTFKQLAVGARFIFASEQDHRFAGLAKGPWVKTSARGYKHETDEQLARCRVGSINVEVVTIDAPVTDLHLAWGKQPACGKVDQPMTGEPARVTCDRCKALHHAFPSGSICPWYEDDHVTTCPRCRSRKACFACRSTVFPCRDTGCECACHRDQLCGICRHEDEIADAQSRSTGHVNGPFCAVHGLALLRGALDAIDCDVAWCATNKK